MQRAAISPCQSAGREEQVAMRRPVLLLNALVLLLTHETVSAAGFLWGHVEDTRGGRSALGGGPAWAADGFSTTRSKEELIRRTRALIYPTNGIYKFIIGLGIPVPLPNKTLALGVNFQFQYNVITNASQLIYPIVVTARSARHHRAAFYNTIEMALDRRGLPGRACLQRAICEAAETPLLHEGLLGELVHMILTPSLGQAPAELLAEYRAAEAAGAAGEECGRRFAACPPGAGLLDHVTCLRPLEEDVAGERAADVKNRGRRRSPRHWKVPLPLQSYTAV